jgi:hypothetical protein
MHVAICSVPLFTAQYIQPLPTHHLAFVFLPADKQGEQVSQAFLQKTKKKKKKTNHTFPSLEKGGTK